MIAKFRGVTEKKQFVYGYLFEDSGEFYIKNKTGCYLVYEETVSQFTGLTDVDNKEVYSDDWVSATVETKTGFEKTEGIVYWNYGSWEVNGFRFKDLNQIKVEVECYNR